MRPEQAPEHRAIVSCSLSHDGQVIAIAVPTYREDLDSRPLRVWVRHLEHGGGWIALDAPDADAPVCGPVIAPDSRHLSVLTSKGGSQIGLVYDCLALNTEPVALVGLPKRAEALKWSGRGHGPAAIGLDADGWRRVWRWTTPNKPPEIITGGGVHAGDFAFNPAGDAMAWLHLPDMQGPAAERLPIQIERFHPRDSRSIKVPGRPLGFLAWSPDGQWLAYLARRSGQRLSNARLWIVDPTRWPEDPSAARCLTDDLEAWITGFDWSHDGQALVVAVAQGTYGRLLEVPLDGPIQEIGNRRTYLSGPHVDRHSGRMVHLAQDCEVPQRLVLREGLHAPPETLTDFHAPLEEGTLLPGETIEWMSTDGLRLDGVVVRPEGVGPYPLAVWVHGGPAEVMSRTFSTYFQVLASAGFAVFAPNYRGSNGRGERFLRASVDDLGGLDGDDVLSGIDRLVQMGVACEQRTALIGWSYGGTLALNLAARSDVIKTVIAGAAVADWVSFFGAPRYPAVYTDYFTGPLWEDRQRLDHASPISHAPDIRCPVLLFHGGNDPIVPPAHSRLMYRALKDLGVDVDLMLYRLEGHVPSRPSVVSDMLERMISWLKSRCLG